MDVPWSSCIRLCVEIIHQLQTAKYNRKECRRLERVVSSVKQYLEQIQRQALTPAGQRAEGHLQEALKRARKHVTRFVSMRPLVCLIMARQLQEKFILLRGELMDSFTLIHAGEQLCRLKPWGKAPQPGLQDVQQLTVEVLDGLLYEQEERWSSMEAAAQIAMRQGSSPESTQRVLLDQLKGLEGFDDMSAEELTTCLEELQVAALCGLDEGRVKPLGSKTEEFLVQQLCQALQRQAVLQENPQQAPAGPSAPPEPPHGFQCPITMEIMVKPVILVETGHTFERASIERWLDGHDTCPVSNQKLTQTPQLVVNYNLQQSIEDWAKQQGYQLPPAPVYQRPFDLDARRDEGKATAVTGNSSSTGGGTTSTSTSSTNHTGCSTKDLTDEEKLRLVVGAIIVEAVNYLMETKAVQRFWSKLWGQPTEP